MFDIDNKTATIQFRITEKEKELVKKIARFQGLTISEFIKKCIKQEIDGLFSHSELLMIQELVECEIATRKENRELDRWTQDRDDLFSILQKVDEGLKKY